MSSSKSSIYFFYELPVNLRSRTVLKQFIQSIFTREKKSLKYLNYIFCSDKRLLDINRQFLEHDYYTDIITFELSLFKAPVEGEIYISVDRVKENAREMNVSFTHELHRVIFHGALHLCGYKDKTKVEKIQIRQKEDYYLSQYALI
jgi:probable rRNA maturation factor